MYPYYILIPDKFNHRLNSYSTDSQSTILGTVNIDPITKFKKHNQQIIDKYTKYDLTCETLKKQKGRAYGHPDTFDQWIYIVDKCFYYSHDHEVLFLSTPKEIFNKFHKDFTKDDIFSFSKLDVDFKSIIQNQYSHGIEGIWLGKVPDIHISALLLLGNKIESSSNYQEFLQQGSEITNLSIIYNYQGTQEKIMITKDGGIILYKQKDETDALLLIEDIFNNLLK